jgi:hypothetical protein
MAAKNLLKYDDEMDDGGNTRTQASLNSEKNNCKLFL